jgi:hypothetical protein
LLKRHSDLPQKDRIGLASELIEKHFDQLYNNFSGIDKRGIRIKTGHNKKL